MIKCPITGSEHVEIIYEQSAVPLIQNKVYPDKASAKNAAVTNVILAQSQENGFVFSADFKGAKIDYDLHYQNEQSNSDYFKKHLENVIEVMEENNCLRGKVIEIGCGKAYFLEMLADRGVDITGFDPTYEGTSTRVTKDFFSDKYSSVGADFIILRHTLEHISEPFDFIKTIAKANNYKGKIFIEVPTFDWIVEHNAIEDIFYEHCNYFTIDTLKMFFKKSVAGHFFNGQYIYLIADLADVKENVEKREFVKYDLKFKDKLKTYDEILRNSASIAIWGAGAKGSTFVNLLDKDCSRVKYVVDINPKKQGQFTGGTGHPIYSPEILNTDPVSEMIIMNTNYAGEIEAILKPLNIKTITL